MRRILPLILLTGGCATFPTDVATTPTAAPPVERRIVLGDPALDFVTVGAPPPIAKNPRRDEEIVQDATFRDFSLVAGTSAETMDNWWSSTGATLIAEAIDPL